MSAQKNLNVNEIAFHETTPPLPPVVMLAEQLRRIARGDPTAAVFSYTTGLPNEFDPSNPPDGIQSNSEQAMLVDRFYRLKTSRECPVVESSPNTGTKRRCRELYCGFRDILNHQEVNHDRQCHYICLLEDCLAPFDKIGNARRHFTTLHSKGAARIKKERFQRRRGSNAQTRAAGRGTVELPASNNRATRSHERRLPQNSLLNIPLLSAIQYESESTVRVAVSSTELSMEDIAMFHNDKVIPGTFISESQSEAEKEWVAVTGLLDLCFNPKKVAYEFN